MVVFSYPVLTFAFSVPKVFSGIIVVKKMVTNSFLLVCNDRIEIHILHTLEDVGLDVGVVLLEGSDELLGLQPFGGSGSVRVAGGAGVREVAGTLKKV